MHPDFVKFFHVHSSFYLREWIHYPDSGTRIALNCFCMSIVLSLFFPVAQNTIVIHSIKVEFMLLMFYTIFTFRLNFWTLFDTQLMNFI